MAQADCSKPLSDRWIQVCKHWDCSPGWIRMDGLERQTQRMAGQLAARLALQQSDWSGGHWPDGRPRWPARQLGSISHAGEWAVAVSGPDSLVALGVDLEEHAALPHADARVVMNNEEWNAICQTNLPDAHATRHWSAKEAAFKAWSSWSDGNLLQIDPLQVHIWLLQLSQFSWQVRALAEIHLPALPPLSGYLEDTCGWVQTLVVANPPARPFQNALNSGA